MEAYHIFLIRHGQTEGNSKGQYIGQTDLPLSGDGVRSLRELAEKYEYPKAELYFSSPLRRCVQSLRILYPGENPEIVPDIAECNFGDFEGKTFAELENDETYRKWVDNSGSGAPPHGESGVEFQARCCRGFARIVDSLMHSGKHSAVIMTHGGTIMSVLSTFGFPRRQFYDWMTANGSGFEAAITPQLWMNGRVIEITRAVPSDEVGGLGAYREMFDDYRKAKTGEKA